MLGPIQEQWADLLWFEKLPQGKGALRIYEGGVCSYCCLGAADEVFCLGAPHIKTLFGVSYKLGLYSTFGEFYWNGLPCTITVNGVAYASLVDMNDSGKTFREIATIMRNYWFLVFAKPV